MPHVLSKTTSKRRRLLTLLLSMMVALAGVVLAPAAHAAVPPATSQPSLMPGNASMEATFTGSRTDPPVQYIEAATSAPTSTTPGPYRRIAGTFTVLSDDLYSFTGTVPDLTNGREYNFYFRAVNADGPGQGSPPLNDTPGRPRYPNNVVVSPRNQSAFVSVSPPLASGQIVDGGFPINGYEYSATIDPSVRDWKQAQVADLSNPSFVIPNLANGTTYEVAVRARNSDGPGAEFYFLLTVVPGLPLAPQLGFPAVVPIDRGGTVTFAPPEDGGKPITGYDVSIAADDATRNWVPAQYSFDEVSQQVTVTVGGLDNGTPYYLAVRARNANGPGADSGANPFTPDAIPAAPTGLSVALQPSTAPSTPGSRKADVSFTAPPGGGGANPTTPFQYTVTSSPEGLQGFCSESPCTVEGLTNGVTYTFTANAQNNVGLSPESAASSSVTPVGTPFATTGLRRVSANPTSLSVSFTAPANGGSPITAYEISIDSGKTWRAASTRVAGSQRLITVAGLRGSTRYIVVVRTRNKLGAGITSSGLSILTGPGTVGRPVARAGTSAVLVRWPANSGRDVVGYTVVSSRGVRCVTQTRVETACILGATAGVSNYYRVYARNATGTSFASTATNTVRASWPSVPSRVPGVPGGFRYHSKKVKSGKKARLTAAGFLPNSSVVLVAYGKKRHIVKRFVTSNSGYFEAVVKMPKDKANSLTFVAFGSTPYGSSKAIATSIRRR